MIAKRVPRNKATSSAARLAKYMVAAKGSIDPQSWARTADYVLDTGTKTGKGERVAGYRVTNCGTDDPAQATIVIEATQRANTRSKADKTYHLVYSFPPGETPPTDVLHAIEDELCEAIGLADHQRISAVHIDTDHLHVHVLINKVHPTGLQNIEPYFDKQRLMEACERLEIKHGLQRTNHGLTQEKQHERDDRIHLEPSTERDSRFRRYLRQSYGLTLTDPPEARTLNGLRHLSRCHMARAGEGSAVLLPGNARAGVVGAGEEQTDSVRRPRDGHRADDGREGGSGGLGGGRPADMEAHAAVESLAGYVAREVAPGIRKATSWAEVHSVLGEHGLEIKLQGAGLVIGDPGIPLWTRASQCGRDLSFKALTDRLGPFQASETQRERSAQGQGPETQRPRRGYAPKPTQPHAASAGLFAEYQRERQANIVKRREGLAKITRENATYRAQLHQWKQNERMVLKVGGKGVTRKIMAETIRQQAEAGKAEQRKEAQRQRDRLVAETTMPTWADWLARKAEQGNLDALAILRSREEREQRMRGDLLTAERAEKAKAVVLDALKPQARKDGSMAYRTIDGGMVIDRTSHVQAARATAGAALVALSLAEKRFEGQALIVEGSEQFRREVAQLAGMHGFKVRFADAAMEQTRQAAVVAKAKAPEGQAVPTPAVQPAADSTRTQPAEAPAPKAPNAGPSVIERWIAERNVAQDKISSKDYTRMRIWEPRDAGAAVYQGRRRMDDGSEVLLLKRGDEMLVKPSSQRVVAMASKWKVGRSVETDARGRFIDKSKAVER